MCDTCSYRWIPCGDQYCRGYRVEIAPPGVFGCPNCDRDHGGVPDHVVRYWPEAWRSLARALDPYKMEPVSQPKVSKALAR